MLQPFERLLPMYVDKLEKLGRKYFVTQYYVRGTQHFSEVVRVPILVSAYDDMGLAKTHLNAVKADKFGAIIDMNRHAHKATLWAMVKGETRFVIYWAVVKDAADLATRINVNYRDKMRRYIEKNTNWRIGRDARLVPSVQLIFGELYINLRHGSQLLRIKFEDIENQS